MWKRLTANGAFAAAILAAPAFAQQTLQDQTEPPAARDQPSMPSEQPQADQAAPGADVVGTTVMSADGENLGEVVKVKESPDGSIESIHVEMGSTMAIGGKIVEIYPDQYTVTEDGIKLSLTAEAADALPEAQSE